jgi:hypothetical protein
MSLIKITIKQEYINSVKKHMTELMSFDEGMVELIIGWESAKERGAKITNNRISDNLYWTFLPTEKRNKFLEHVSGIETIVLDYLKQTKTVVNINPLKFKNQKEFLDFIKKELIECKVYLFNERLYLYKNKTIYHIDLGLLNFMSWDILQEIKEYFNIIEIEEFKYKKYLNYLDFKYIPYIIDAKENTTTSDICKS